MTTPGEVGSETTQRTDLAFVRRVMVIVGVLQAAAFWIILPPDFIRNEVVGSLILLIAGMLFLAALVLSVVVIVRGQRVDRLWAALVMASLLSQVVTLVVLYIVNN